LSFTPFSVRGKVQNEIGFVFMAVNLRKYTAVNSNFTKKSPKCEDKKITQINIEQIKQKYLIKY